MEKTPQRDKFPASPCTLTSNKKQNCSGDEEINKKELEGYSPTLSVCSQNSLYSSCSTPYKPKYPIKLMDGMWYITAKNVCFLWENKIIN